MDNNFEVKTSVGYYVSVWKDENRPRGIYEILVVINEPNEVKHSDLHKIGEIVENYVNYEEYQTSKGFKELEEKLEDICPWGSQIIINPNYYNS